MTLHYAKTNEFEPRAVTDIEAFYSGVHEYVFEAQPPARQVWTQLSCLVELQPGDGTRYRICITRLGRLVVVSMIIPTFCVMELDLDGGRPCPWDDPICRLNPYTAAILADVLAVIWGDEERFYDYEKHKPKEG